MKTVANPFFVKGAIPAEYFCDRIDETQTLIKHIKNGRNVMLTAPRRVGKTGLIDHCYQQAELKDNYHTIFVDILETSCLRDFAYLLGRQIFETLKTNSRKMLDLFVQTVRSISGEFGYDATTGLPKFNIALGAISNPAYTLDEIFTYIDKADRRCVIAIDEFQQIVNYPENNVEALLRTHIQHCGNADFIFAGSERHILEEMFNNKSRPFYASTTTMTLNKLSVEKYADFVAECFEKFGRSIDDNCTERVYRLLDGNTYCMQKAFNTAFALTNEGEKCTLETLHSAIDDILLENERQYQNRLSLLTPRPKELLLAIATDGTAQRITSGEFVRRHRLDSTSSVQSATKQLLATDLITHFAGSNGLKTYALTDQFMTLWIQERFGNGYNL
ncbi:MAG: ATP-binding protein [Salinivirgaceae bacterium]|nr:ATP-binding protein [Salinivirgaceae bacterium]